LSARQRADEAKIVAPRSQHEVTLPAAAGLRDTAPLLRLRRALSPLARRVRASLRRMPGIGPPLVRAELVRSYTRFHGRPPRLDPPVGFNEHVLHRLLHDRDKRLKVINDKLALRDFIRQRVGADFVVPLLGVWRDPSGIDWAGLPIPFVLKPNHASGHCAFVRTPEDLDPARLAALARGWLRTDYFDEKLEWGYRGLPRRLLAEPLLRGADGGAPPEAQVFTFGGRAHLIRVMTGMKGTPERRDNWFDRDGVRQAALRLRTQPGSYVLPPEQARRLTEVAEQVADGFVHMRVDFYLTESGLKIGELTPYTLAGTVEWSPPDWDERLGRVWTEAARHGR
jgi:hypothetical protein